MAKTEKKFDTVDGNAAAAHVAYAFSEVAAIYPITPSSTMGELADQWSAEGRKNIFGEKLQVIEMQSEGGAAGAIHGSLSTGALTTTFTASQGLLLMLPNMFKISGELLPTVFHVSARSLAAQSLSIFGDHQDVMAARTTGFAMLNSCSVQEAHDMAIIAHLASLESKVPFLHFFDGFRTSSEIQKVELADYSLLKSLLDIKYVKDLKSRALLPEHPFSRVGAQNPDVYFQGRERANEFYLKVPAIVKKSMALVGKTFGRKYKLFDYVGAKDAKKIIVAMGSGCETIEETVNYLTAKGEKVGAIKVRLYRPFFVEDFLAVLPKTVKKIAVLDRTKEPGSEGEPLYLDVVAALKGTKMVIIGGRYGLSSKEFTPSMVNAVFVHLDKECFHNFTVGIEDDITKKSLKIKEIIHTEPKGTIRCKFWGYGSDGTVGANKNSIKIIGDYTDMQVQGYFEYDSKKCGGVTISHLRFGKKHIQSEYLLTESDFIALHKSAYIGKYDVLYGIKENGTFLLNANFKPEEAFSMLSRDMQEEIIKKKVKFYIIDANKISNEVGLGQRINTVMQTVFFKLSGVLPEDKAIHLIKEYTKKTYAKKGHDIVNLNMNAIDKACDGLHLVTVPEKISDIKSSFVPSDSCKTVCPAFINDVLKPVMSLKGNTIPVSKMSIDGSIPTGTTKYEKRGIAESIPEWFSERCIQCGFCSFVCPHASIRIKQILPDSLKGAPATFKTIPSNVKNDKGYQYRVQVYPDDCTGCGVCAETCPAKGKALVMRPIWDARKAGEVENFEFFEKLPYIAEGTSPNTVKGSQLRQQLFEFSGACLGCGEAPYLKILSQLYGDRMVIANATGCTSIYSGTFPSIPYTVNDEGRGPAWANSLFEDNAEFGFGMRNSIDANRKHLFDVITELVKVGTITELDYLLKKALELWSRTDKEAMDNANSVIKALPHAIKAANKDNKELLEKLDMLKYYFVEKSVWIIGGDGWAYDIGYGGLDHVIAQGKKVNILVLDTEMYSNTGGQQSKATPRGAVAKFAASGKKMPKKNLGLIAMSYGYVYVASIDMGADKIQALKAFLEAESYDGPSIIVAYSPCQEQGINMTMSQQEGKRAADASYWPLYRYDPRLISQGKNPLQMDSKAQSLPFQEFLEGEIRFRTLKQQYPEEAERLFKLSEEDAKKRLEHLKTLSEDLQKEQKEQKETTPQNNNA